MGSRIPPQPDQHVADPALLGAIDLHVHHDPDSYPRAADAVQERGLRGMVLKNHWTETGGLAYLVRKYATPGFEVFGAVTRSSERDLAIMFKDNPAYLVKLEPGAGGAAASR